MLQSVYMNVMFWSLLPRLRAPEKPHASGVFAEILLIYRFYRAISRTAVPFRVLDAAQPAKKIAIFFVRWT